MKVAELKEILEKEKDSTNKKKLLSIFEDINPEVYIRMHRTTKSDAKKYGYPLYAVKGDHIGYIRWSYGRVKPSSRWYEALNSIVLK